MGRHAGFIIMCCVCRKVRSRNGIWYYRRQLSEENTISHTYCPKCADRIMAEMKLKRKKTMVHA